MNPSEKISKSSWSLLESIQDVLTTNVTTAFRAGQLKIDNSQLEKLLTILSTSAAEGYHRGHRSFMKVVESVISDVASDATFDMVTKKSSQPTKKK